MFETRLKQITK